MATCRPSVALGFTLLELLVVLVLLAGLTALTAPTLTRFLQEDALRTATRQSIGFLQQTAALARQEQRLYVLRYDAGRHALVAEPADGAGQRQGRTRTRSLRLPQTVRLLALQPRQERPVEGAPRLYISGKGYAEPALISMASAEERERLSLVVSPFLGTVRVVDGDVDVRAAGLFR